MSRIKKLRKRAIKGLIAGFERADEIGGEIRDYVQEKVLVDERYIGFRKRFAEMRGTTYESKVEREHAQVAKAQAAAQAAPPKASTVPVVEKTLGDPELPAQLYGTEADPWTGRAITLLESLKVDYDYVDVDDPDNEHYVAELTSATKQNNVPFILCAGSSSVDSTPCPNYIARARLSIY